MRPTAGLIVQFCVVVFAWTTSTRHMLDHGVRDPHPATTPPSPLTRKRTGLRDIRRKYAGGILQACQQVTNRPLHRCEFAACHCEFP